MVGGQEWAFATSEGYRLRCTSLSVPGPYRAPTVCVPGPYRARSFACPGPNEPRLLGFLSRPPYQAWRTHMAAAAWSATSARMPAGLRPLQGIRARGHGSRSRRFAGQRPLQASLPFPAALTIGCAL